MLFNPKLAGHQTGGIRISAPSTSALPKHRLILGTPPRRPESCSEPHHQPHVHSDPPPAHGSSGGVGVLWCFQTIPDYSAPGLGQVAHSFACWEAAMSWGSPQVHSHRVQHLLSPQTRSRPISKGWGSGGGTRTCMEEQETMPPEDTTTLGMDCLVRCSWQLMRQLLFL